MEYILVLLIVALLNGAIAYIDGLMEGIIPLTLYAEQYMSTLAGVDLFQSLFDIVFGFGVSLIVLKFLKKGFETYVLWSDGDADEEPIAILTNFFKAMAVAICFPTMYDWLATIDVYKRQWLRYDFDNTQVYKETDGAVSPFQITAVAWAGYQLTADHALKDVIGRISLSLIHIFWFLSEVSALKS